MRHSAFASVLAAVLCAVLAWSAPGAAAAPGRWDALATPLFAHIGIEQGLPHPLVMALAQDHDGYMWFGTQGGLARWDGYRMRVFRHDAADPGSLPADYIQTLHVDRQGRLWVGTATGALARFDKGTQRFVRTGALSSPAVHAIASDALGGIWAGTGAGLDYIDNSGALLRHSAADPQLMAGLPAQPVRALHMDPNGTLWIGSPAGLARRDPASGRIDAVAVYPGEAWRDTVLSIARNSRGQLAFGTLKSGIGIVEPGARVGRLLQLPDLPDLASSMILALAEPSPGKWWASTYGGGVVEVDAVSGRARRILHQPAVAASLASDRSAALLRDQSGLLWVSNERGVDFHDPSNRALSAIYGGAGVAEAGVTALLNDGAGRVWVALADQGIDVIEADGSRRAALRPDPARPDSALPRRIAMALAQAPGGELWIGTQLGLYRSSAGGTQVRRVPLAQANPSPRVAAIATQRARLWLATFEGLLRYDPETGAVDSPAGLTDNRVQALLADGDSALWVGTFNGLNRLDTASGKIEQIKAAPGVPSALSDPLITSLVFDGAGRLWVATYGGGINVMTGRGPGGEALFRRIGRADGLQSGAVAALRLDRSGRMWASTTDGMAVIDTASFKVRTLGRADGVAFPTFFAGAATVSADDDLLFGATGGLVVVQPERLGSWTYRAPLVVSALRVDGRPVMAAAGSRVTLAPGTRSIEVEMALLDYSDPSGSRYAHKLEGYDRQWIEGDATRRLATYANLGPGDYRLLLRGASRAGPWSERTATLDVRVLPAWHQTWWAYGSMAVAALLLAYALFHLRLRQLERSRAVLQAMVQARTRHLEKLNAIVRSINEQPDFDTLLRTILQESGQIDGIEHAWALVREAEGDALAVRAAWSRDGGAAAPPAATVQQAELRYVDGAESIARDLYLRRHADGAVLALRVCIDERVDGYLVFDSGGQPDRFSGDELDLLKALKEPYLNAFQKANVLRRIDAARANAEAATRAKSDFLANISHEIRTPMNAILGFAGLGSNLDLPHKPLDYFRKIGRAGNKLLDIINDVLDFSKIESGKLELEILPFDLSDTLSQIVDLFAWRAAEKDLELVVWAAPEVPLLLQGDALRLGQVLINLVGNALKFTQRGHIELRVEQAGAALRFSVRDTGVGIGQEQQGRLFQAFAQADASTTRVFGGTGLGLAISQQLVRQMGGQIAVDSIPGAGSTFSFCIELASVDEARLQAVPAAHGKRVLVVDDSEPTRVMLEQQLRGFGFTASAVGSGAAALFALELEPTDLVLMDWNMPDMDGIETARRIRADPLLAHVPAIIMVTAYARDQLRQSAEQAGIGAFLVKPVAPSQLLDCVMQALGIHAEPPARPVLPPPSEAALQISGAQVLVVDDNLVNQQVAGEILRRAGVHVALANNGVEAVAMVDERRYDAVLMDIQMPEMDGYQASAHIRAQPRHAALPIIAMTAHAVAGYRESCLSMGMNDYLTKPIVPAALFETLARWIGADPARVAAPQEDLQQAPPGSLPGIDAVAALERLGGNAALLERLVALFQREFGSTGAQLHAALAQGDHARAAQLVHKVKGAAANLCADALQRAASDLEAALQADHAAAELVARFDAALLVLIGPDIEAGAVVAVAPVDVRAGGQGIGGPADGR